MAETDSCQLVLAESPTIAVELPRVGRWAATRLAYSGRWSRVYRARPADASPNRIAEDYALKLPPERDSTAIQMLQREVWVASRVRHPHLVTVLESRIDRPPFYSVSPWLDGCSLRTALRPGNTLSIATPTALWIARQMAEALAALHQSGWRHGDVKPENIFLAAGVHATLLDLGMATSIDSPTSTSNRAPFCGTVEYAAPETLCEHESTGASADVYSLGIVLMEMLAGFPDGNAAATPRLSASDFSAWLRRRRPELSVRACQFLQRLLAQQPLRRPSAEEAARQLAELEIDAFDDWAAE